MNSSIVLDASVTVAWAFHDQVDRYCNLVRESLVANEALVPAIWPLEVVNALLIAERRKAITRSSTDHFLQFLAELPIIVEAQPLDATWNGALAVARNTGLSAYDASYLHLASRTSSPIATLDKAMRNAAKRVGVEVFKP